MVSYDNVKCQRKTNDPILRKLSDGGMDGQTDRQTDESDFIGCCQTDVERPNTKIQASRLINEFPLERDLKVTAFFHEINNNPLSANFTKWSDTLKHFVGNLLRNLSVFDHFVGLALKRLRWNV